MSIGTTTATLFAVLVQSTAIMLIDLIFNRVLTTLAHLYNLVDWLNVNPSPPPLSVPPRAAAQKNSGHVGHVTLVASMQL
jgi:hypothetical protein